MKTPAPKNVSKVDETSGKRFPCVSTAFPYPPRIGNGNGFLSGVSVHHRESTKNCRIRNTGYMTSTDSISHRLGGFYCLYCLHETQPFKPPFRIYICIRQMKLLKELVIDARQYDIGVVPLIVNRMLERNFFLYGAIDLKEGSVEERLNELTYLQNARVQHANKKLFADTKIEHYIHMDMGKELDIDSLKKVSLDYSIAKDLAIKEAGKVMDTKDIKHIAENQTLIGDVVRKTTEAWNVQKETFYQKTGLNQPQMLENQSFEQQNSNRNLDAVALTENSAEPFAEKDDAFGDELEQLLSLTEF